MNIASNPYLGSTLIKFIIFVAALKLLNITAIYFLPKSSISKVVTKGLDLPYYAIRLDKVFEKQKEVPKEKPKPSVEELFPITDLILKAIYGNTNNKKNSFIMVVEKNKKETNLLSIGDTIRKYKFIDVNIAEKEAIFEAGDRLYTLKIDTIKDKKITQSLRNIAPSNTSKPQLFDDVILAVPKGEVLKYKNNFKDIWKNIAIKEVLKKGRIDGFLITYIKSGTIFSRLGLKAGDIIKSINNNPLKSYADAFGVYYKIENTKALKITILRENKERELEYEIY